MISIHALLAESDLSNNSRRFLCPHFYPRSPCGERQCSLVTGLRISDISIHALLAESDCYAVFCHFWGANFYPRSPCGERLPRLPMAAQPQNFYPRSPCGERQHCPVHPTYAPVISIHALLAESDHRRPDNHQQRHHISIHALLAESDITTATHTTTDSKFLSTLSLRRATTHNIMPPKGQKFLSTLSLRRATGA